eukprot:4870732-Amphidinium_carterae.1
MALEEGLRDWLAWLPSSTTRPGSVSKHKKSFERNWWMLMRCIFRRRRRSLPRSGGSPGSQPWQHRKRNENGTGEVSLHTDRALQRGGEPPKLGGDGDTSNTSTLVLKDAWTGPQCGEGLHTTWIAMKCYDLLVENLSKNAQVTIDRLNLHLRDVTAKARLIL